MKIPEECWESGMKSTAHPNENLKVHEYLVNRAWIYGAYCQECDSETCIYNPDGICLAPLVLGRDLDWSEESGCLDYVDDGENW